MLSIQQSSSSMGLIRLAVPVEGNISTRSTLLPSLSRFFSRTKHKPTDAVTLSNSDHTLATKSSKGEGASRRAFCVVSRDFSATADSPSNQTASSVALEDADSYASDQSDALYAIMLKSTEHKKRVLVLQKENDALKLRIKQLEEQLECAGENRLSSSNRPSDRCSVTAEDENEQHEMLVSSLRAALEGEVERRIEAEMALAADRAELLRYHLMHGQAMEAVVVTPPIPRAADVSAPLVNAFVIVDNDDEPPRLGHVVSNYPTAVDSSHAAHSAAEMTVEIVNQTAAVVPSTVQPPSTLWGATPLGSPSSTALEGRDSVCMPKRCTAIRRSKSSRRVASAGAGRDPAHGCTLRDHSSNFASSRGGRIPFQALDNGITLLADRPTRTSNTHSPCGSWGTLEGDRVWWSVRA